MDIVREQRWSREYQLQVCTRKLWKVFPTTVLCTASLVSFGRWHQHLRFLRSSFGLTLIRDDTSCARFLEVYRCCPTSTRLFPEVVLGRSCHRDGFNVVSWPGFADVDMTWFGDDCGTLSQHRRCPRRYRRYFRCRILWPFGLGLSVLTGPSSSSPLRGGMRSILLSLRAVTVLACRGS